MNHQKNTNFEAIQVIEAHEFRDSRGTFKKIFDSDKITELIHKNFQIKQVNISHNPIRGTVRGMHMQKEPFGESKIVFCSKGILNDVVVDLRKGSETYLQVYSFLLNESDNKLVYIPSGFAHGYQTLKNDSELIYLSNNEYAKDFESGLNPLDPIVKSNWSIPISQMSDRDQSLPIVPLIK